MRTRRKPWLTVQLTAMSLDTTSSQVHRLLNLGRLFGTKQKLPGGSGKEQWLVDPKSISREKRYRSRRAALARR
jgi:hypothetical protein